MPAVLIQLTDAQVASVIAQNGTTNINVVVDPPHVDPQPPYVPPTNLPGYAKLMEIPWQTLYQGRSAEVGGFGLGDTLICHFRTGAAMNFEKGSVGAVEFPAGGTQIRHACLSRTPGDMVNGGVQVSVGPSFFFVVNTQPYTPQNFAEQIAPPMQLLPNTDYYLNLQNDQNTNETAHDVQVTLKAPRGTA